MFEIKYAKMPDSAGEDSDAESNAATSVAAQSDDDRSTMVAGDNLPTAANAEVDEVSFC